MPREVGGPAASRSYGQSCPVAHALDLIGERWAMLVLRELRLGGRRYADLQTALPGISPSVLAQRLQDLLASGVVRRRILPAPGRVQIYELTDWGTDLEPVFQALARWGIRSPVVPLRGDLSDDTVMLGVRTFFAAQRSWSATFAVELENERYRLSVQNGSLMELARGEPAGPVDATVSTDRWTLQGLMQGSSDPRDVLASRSVRATGDEKSVALLLAAITAHR